LPEGGCSAIFLDKIFNLKGCVCFPCVLPGSVATREDLQMKKLG
jgi:hypothetical protein